MTRAWLRILLCGMVAGMTWFLLSALSLWLLGQKLLTAVQRAGSHPRPGGEFVFGIDVLMGVWAMWLYSAIAPRYGTGHRAAAVLAPLITTLVSTVAASTLGAWLYEKVDLSATQARQG